MMPIKEVEVVKEVVKLVESPAVQLPGSRTRRHGSKLEPDPFKDEKNKLQSHMNDQITKTVEVFDTYVGCVERLQPKDSPTVQSRR